MKYYPKRCVLIAYLVMVLLRFFLFNGATKVTPFELVYGQEAVLPVEVNLDAYRLAKQNDLSDVDYHDLMMDNIDGVTDKGLKVLKEIEKDKLRVARAYNKR